jgi:tetrahydromethanopterin S-methyltransferase subunit D
LEKEGIGGSGLAAAACEISLTAGYFALAFLFAPGVWARYSMCGQVGSCHGDDKVQKCPKNKSGALRKFFGLDGLIKGLLR